MGSIEPESQASPPPLPNNYYQSQNGNYIIKEQPIGALRHIRVIGIGAGASGINMIRTLKLNTTSFEHVIYERNADIGGTWYENRYPGCKCDIPSHSYQFSHTPNPGWSALFSEAGEIQNYLQHVCDKYDLRENIKLSHSIIHAIWEETAGQWVLKVRNEITGVMFEDRCHFLLDSSGILNDWKWPDIKGLHSFQGDLIHSARWPENFDYKNKRVAVIGNGSSGIQIVPAIQLDVAKLVHFIRSPTWITPPQEQMMDAALTGIKMDSNNNFTQEQIKDFKENPEIYKKFVKRVEKSSNSRFKWLIVGSKEAEMARMMLTGYMSRMLNNDPILTAALIPDFPVGCRRITPGVGYLQALVQDNVRVESNSIAEVCSEGIRLLDGELIELDAIVCATGFNVSFVPRFPMIGEHGNLQDLWRDRLPGAYMSCAVAGMPNYFTFLGPNAPIGHGSVLTITEHLSTYILSVLKKCQLEHIHSVRPLPAAIADFTEHIEAFMPRTAWAGTCTSWFKNGKSAGPVTALHPGGRIHWFHMLEKPRWEDFEWRVEGEAGKAGNRFAYLGNGFSTREAEGENACWYLDEGLERMDC